MSQINSRSKVAPSRRSSTQSRLKKLTRTGWVTRQHGAWSMTLVPVFVGSALGGFTWWQLLLGISWLIAFQAFDAFGLWVQAVAPRKSRSGSASQNKLTLARGRKYVNAILTYSVVAASTAAVLIMREPRLLWLGLGIAPLALISIFEMWQRRPASFLARSSAIVASALPTPAAFMLGSHPVQWEHMWTATILLIAYFVGTIPYIKTLLREKGNKWWLNFSISYHATFTVVALAGALTGRLTWWVFICWVILTVRAIVFPYVANRRQLRPAVFGISEFLFSAIVVAAILLP